MWYDVPSAAKAAEKRESIGAAGDMDIIWGLLLGIGVLAALFLAGLFLIKPRREQRKL